MDIYINDEAFAFEMKAYLKVFYPTEPLNFTSDSEKAFDYAIQIEGSFLGVAFYAAGKKAHELHYDEAQLLAMKLPEELIARRKQVKNLLKSMIYTIELEKGTTPQQPWGILTGIRPTKVLLNLLEKTDYNIEQVRTILKSDYKIADHKIDLMLEIATHEAAILKQNNSDEISLYVGIPFCPTKCLYCSFTSFPIEKWKGFMTPYLEALYKELCFVADEMIGQKKLRSVYIGGGTPTSLNANQLEALLKSIHAKIDLQHLQEFTVEAGRPDTITREKLQVLKDYGVHRISINPQTMHDQTLKTIGRNHTTQDLINAYEAARTIGFETINMDIIIGLPGETTEHVRQTMSQIKELAPENLTVHVMAIKKGSDLMEHLSEYALETAQTIEEMLEITSDGARKMGLKPYYLYRQKHMVGNFENVGYAKEGHECIYNIEIIEERQTIIAIGAGAMTKVVTGPKVERIENIKDLPRYISRI
ncbi:MAG: coproporphyrinogen dehydrogenase HemZ, partial [Vallitaleaceae bacterium]|nr:coproporphyrinogen dehydrogenase HemZ [Vallitaleaceae bacterium]